MHQGCVPKAVLQGLARGEGTGHLPSPLAEHPFYCGARPSRTLRTNPPAGWRMERAWKRAQCPHWPQATRGVGRWGRKGSLRLLVRDQGVMPNPEHPSLGSEDPKTRGERIHRLLGHQEPRSHASGTKASCPVWGPSIFTPVPGSPDLTLRGGGGALCFSNAPLTRTPRAQSGSPSTLPKVTPARPVQGGAAALPSRCLTESVDGGGGMSELSPSRGGRG